MAMAQVAEHQDRRGAYRASCGQDYAMRIQPGGYGKGGHKNRNLRGMSAEAEDAVSMATTCTPENQCGKVHLVFRCDRCSRLAYRPDGCNGWCQGVTDDGDDSIRIRGEPCELARKVVKPRVKFKWDRPASTTR